MDFSLSDEQSMLADSVAKFIDNDYNFESRQKIAQAGEGYSRELWQTYAELGWTAVPFAEDDGGLGGGPIELMLMMEQFGRGLVVEPYLATVVLAGGILRRVASAEQKEQWLSGIIEGRTQAALAFAEPQARFEIADITTRAEANGSGFILNGKKNLVLNGSSADLLIIPARSGGAQSDENGITLFAVPSDSAGIERMDYATVDAHQAAEITLKDVHVESASLLGEVGQGAHDQRAQALLEPLGNELRACTDNELLAVETDALRAREPRFVVCGRDMLTQVTKGGLPECVGVAVHRSAFRTLLTSPQDTHVCGEVTDI